MDDLNPPPGGDVKAHIQKLVAKIYELEQRIRDLEARPTQIINHNYPVQPYFNPLQPQVWCGTINPVSEYNN